MMTLGLLGAGIGLGLWAIVVWLFPARPPLAQLLARLDATPPPEPILTPDAGGWATRMGRVFVPALTALGLPQPRLRRDLAVTGTTVDHYLAEKAIFAVTGLLLPTLVGLAVTLAGISLPWMLPLGAGVVLAAIGFVVPDLTVRQEAARRRSSFRHALSAYLNLIQVMLAGGAGVDAALTDAANIGDGWAFTQLRRALTTARFTRTTAWASLRQLGEELDVPELTELAASVSLAGTEGAKVRTSLAAKAATLRIHELASAESDAHAATERMSLPVVVLFVGFLVFLGYPALAQVVGSL